jgi:hypothetical protein
VRVLAIVSLSISLSGLPLPVLAGPPNLSGTYDVATLTPLRRPPEFGDNLYLTREQADALAARDRQRLEADSALSDPDREAPPEGGDGSAGAAGNVGGYNTFWIDNGDQAFSLDGKFRTSIITYPANGRPPGYTSEGEKKAALRAKRRRENTGTAWWLEEEGPGPYDHPEMRPLAERCLLGFGPVAGPPMFPALYNNVKRIIQTDDYVMIMAEMVHDARVIRLNAEHRPDGVRTWLGDSIGWWEGDTLVVETKNFKNGFAAWMKTRSIIVSKLKIRPFGQMYGGETIPGRKQTKSSLNMPAMKATTLLATSCAVRAFSNRMWRVWLQLPVINRECAHDCRA